MNVGNEPEQNRSAYWDSVSKSYDRFYEHLYSQKEDEELRKWLGAAVGNSVRLRVLDIGCGTGFGFELLKGAIGKFSYVGIDISEGMISQFQSKIRQMIPNVDIRLKVGDARYIEQLFPANSFDLIMLLNDAASYVGGPTRLLRNVRLLLSENGVVFASFLNRHSLRRIFHQECEIVETYNTRGAEADLRGVTTVTVSHKELLKRCARVGLRPEWIRYQSILGGVCEADAAVPLEAIAKRVASRLGHTINLLAKRSAMSGEAR